MAITLGVGPVVTEPVGASTTLVISLTGTTAGRSIVVGASHSSDIAISSITCNGEANLTEHGSSIGHADIGLWGHIASLANITTGGDKTITITFASSASNRVGFALELIGGDTANWFDTSIAVTGFSANPSANITTSKNRECIVAWGASNASDPTPGANYTNIPISISFQTGEYDLDAGSAGVVAVNFVAGNNTWVIKAAAFKDPLIDRDGAVTFSQMSAAGGPAASGATTFQNMSALGQGPPYGIGTFVQMSASGGPSASGVASFAQMSAQQTIAGAATFEQMTAAGWSTSGVPAFEQMTAAGMTGSGALTAFEQLTAFGDAHAGAEGVGVFGEMSATGICVPPVVVSGAATFEAMTGLSLFNAGGAVAFGRLEASGIGRGPVNGAVSFEPMIVISPAGAVSFERMTAFGLASEVPGELYDTKVMNTRLAAMTEFTNYKFNSFARIGKDYYGVGPNGLFRLDGASDNGTSINWSLRTGRHDDKKIVIKRIPEVVLGLRSNGFITVRVWSDDNTFHDYALPRVDTTTLHQHRVVPGKGLQSKYFGIELRGTRNATLELDSMQVDMKPLGTRLG